MKRILLAAALIITGTSTQAQTTWAEHTAEIFYQECTMCHNPNGVGPFSLMTYQDAQANMSLIATMVNNNEMPPWYADTTYQRYAHERILTAQEKQDILDWVSQGGQEGNPGLAPPPPTYSNQGLLGTPDLKVTIPTYMSKAMFADDYVCFTLPTGLAQAKKIKAVEVIPGNPNITHHVLIYADDDNSYPTDTVGSDCGGPTNEPAITGWAPGGLPTVFPSGATFNTGMTIQAGGSVVLAMHYPIGSYGQYDSTSVHFFFHDDTVQIREVQAYPFIQDWSFCFLPNQIDSVEAEFPPPGQGVVPFDYTLLSVFPHMHLLGQNIKSWNVSATNDTTPLINIPHYDFDWQDFYWFKYLQKIPAGSKVYAKGVYDNTVGNPHNPNSPPQTVCAGLNTTDEMFLIYFHYMDYEPGDEFINQDSLTQVYLSNKIIEQQVGDVKAYPNPFNDRTTIEFNTTEVSDVNLYIYDLHGRLVKRVFRGKVPGGKQQFEWAGESENGREVPSGVYIYSILVNGQHSSGRIVYSKR